MKYVRTSLLVGVVCLGIGSARAEEAAPVAATLDVPVLSAYVWRGQVLNDKTVVEPSLTVSKNGFSLNTWANYNAAGSYSGDNNQTFSEVDLTASYSRSVGPASLGVGVVQYTFPNQTLSVTDGSNTTSEAYPSTYELYASVGLPNVLLAPALTVYRDLDAIDGFYAMLAVSQSYALCDKASVGGSASIGAGDEDYNKGYFGKDQAALNDAIVGLAVPVAVLDNLTVKPAVSYVFLPDSAIGNAADSVYGNKEQLVASITASYTF